MNIAKFSIEHRVTTLVLTCVMLGAGFLAYENMSRLEDPEFTIKEALVMTPYPGATASEVEEEVSDRVEKEIQKLGQIKRIESRSERGLSTLTVVIKDEYDKSTLPQVWDELRRKVNDVQRTLPPGAGPSLVFDDYGDVYGIFVAISGEGYSYAELKDVTDFLRRELLLVQDVAKIDTYGERTEAIYVELNRDRMSKLGISPETIISQLRFKNLVANAGQVEIGSEFIAIEPSGEIKTVEQFGNILVSHKEANEVYLNDIAHIWRGYVEPQTNMLNYDGKSSIGLGISTTSGGNVVTMGAALQKRLKELEAQLPLGIEYGMVSVQSEAVTKAISNFVNSLIQAVAIVVVVLLLFMGVRSGLLIGFVLVLTIAASFIFLAPMDVALERISLGALIIALGMLVDNAIVVVDGVLVKVDEGKNAKEAAIEIVNQTALPLLGATVIAILGFAAIGTSDDSTGEFCRSLFQVVLVSLLLSWVIAITITPLLCVMFLNKKQQDSKASEESVESENSKAPAESSSKLIKNYKKILKACIRKKGATISIVGALFVSALWGFTYIEQSFFPPSTRAQFKVDLWFPQGTHIDFAQERTEIIEKDIKKMDYVTHITSLVGQGGLRFLLTYTPEKPNSAYVQLLVNFKEDVEREEIDKLMLTIEEYLENNHPDIVGYTSRFQLGPGSTGKIQARFSGPDPDVLRDLADQVKVIYHADPDAKGIRTDWRQRVKVIKPIVAEEQANLNGISRMDIASTILEGFQKGTNVGIFRDGNLLIPIILRASEPERNNVKSLYNLQIWSPAANTMIPLRQVVSEFKVAYEDDIVMRRNRKRTITVFADPIKGQASELFERVKPHIEAIELPVGYELEWGGEYEDAADAQAGLKQGLPVFLLMMVLITVMLFDSLRQPLIIWAVVPLALIGVTVGLLITNQPFGFMSLLGILSLIGMLIKNAIVLIDEINLQKQDKDLATAIVDSGVNRLRPVSMAALTTALGMIPLVFDAFFAAMAVTIIAGLVFATVLTMIVVPVLYASFYKARIKS